MARTRRVYKAQWRAAHREHLRVYRAQWRANHRKKLHDYMVQYHADHRDKLNADRRRYYQEHHSEIIQQLHTPAAKKKARFAHLLRKYGLTERAYTLLLKQQHGRCKLCGTKKPGGIGTFHVDHEHHTGRIRAILCNNCNALLGYAQDSIERLQKAISYLQEFKETS